MKWLLIRLLVLSAILAPTGCGKAGPTSSEIDAAVQARLGSAAVRGERLLEAGPVSRFYKGRNGAHAWDDKDPGEILQAIRDIAQDGLNPRDYHLAAIERLLEQRKKETSAALEGDLDILLTDAPDLLATCGLFRPRVLLPSHARNWSEERIRVGHCHVGDRSSIGRITVPADWIQNRG